MIAWKQTLALKSYSKCRLYYLPYSWHLPKHMQQLVPCGKTYIYRPRYRNAPESNKSTSITNWKRVNSLSSEKWRRLQVPLGLKLSERPVITLISNTSIELLFPWFMFTEKIKCIFPLGREPDVMHQIEVRYVGRICAIVSTLCETPKSTQSPQ